MIPKIIHYCWFGKGPKPELAIKCIDSWRKYLPEYELKEWNESNFDINMFPYTKEAYENRKFAFVTDVVRLYALYTEGGIYMDTDVEVIKPLDCFLHHEAFSGFENKKDVPTGIMASVKKGKWVKDNLDYYIGKHFVNPDGTLNLTTNVKTITDLMIPYGLKRNNTYQEFKDYITFYPNDYFCPINVVTSKLELTKNTVTIHHFTGSWMDRDKSWKNKIKKHLPNWVLITYNTIIRQWLAPKG